MATKGMPRRDARAAKTSTNPGGDWPERDRGYSERAADCHMILKDDGTFSHLVMAARRPPASGDDRASSDVEVLFRKLAAQAAREFPEPPGVVVLHEIGGIATADGRRVAQEFSSLTGARLRLVPAPDLGRVRGELERSFPHAAPVLDGVLGPMTGRRDVAMRPTLLVGSPGCGKTSFAQALLSALGIPALTYPCGGAACAALAGAPRRWSTGEPCALVPLFAANRVASPGVILDELEKVATGKQNGSLHDGLLSMLEPTTRGAWMDPYLQAALDLSHVVWIATANSLEGVPHPLRDRFRIVRFPDPGPEHLATLASSLMRAALAERGLDERWALPLDGVELAALAEVWRGGSIRRLARLVEGVLAARDRAPVLC